MAGPVSAAAGGEPFDLIVYTSSIEHMQPASQKQSLDECRQLAKPNTTLYLTCPVTPVGQNGYNCQYAAHVYEPGSLELQRWLTSTGWKVARSIGLSTGSKHFRAVLTGTALAGAERLYQLMPREQALPTIAVMYPMAATEIAFICSAV
jgi:hypothetical protein